MDSKDFRGSIYGLGFCSLSALLIAEAPILLVPALLMALIPGTVGIVRSFFSLANAEKPGVVAAEGMGLILSDLKLGQPTHDIDEKEVTKGLVKVAQITRIPFTKTSDTKWWIKGKDLINTSWVVLGPRGSGKSLTMRWMAREALKDGADVYWFDWHHNPEGDEHIDVLPGVPHEDYVMSCKAKQVETLNHWLKVGQERLEGKHGKNFKPVVIFWDEFQDITSTALRDPFDFSEQEWVNDAIRMIQDGFRKAKIQIVLSLKSVKKGQSGLDMSTLLQCNWLFTGAKGKNFSALEDKSAIFPDEISDNRSSLVTAAKGMLDANTGVQGAVCLIDGESSAKAHPDCNTLVKMLKKDNGFEVETATEEGFDDVAAFFHPHMMQIEAAIAKGDSKSSVFLSLPGHGEKAKRNPKWARFAEIYDSIKQRLEEQ